MGNTVRITFAAILVLLLLLAATAMAAENGMYDEAVGYYNGGKYEKAVELLSEYVKKSPEPKAYYLLGYSYYKLGKFAEANENFKMASLLEPTYSPTPELEKKHNKPLTNARPEGGAPSSILAPAPSVPAGEVKPETIVVPSQPAPTTAPAQPAQPVAPARPAAPAQPVQPSQPAVPAQPIQPAPIQPIQPAQPAQPFTPPAQPMPPYEIPTMPAGNLGAMLLAAGMTVLLVIAAVFLVFYLFFCYCMFRIAKKLDVPAAWLAFIPVLQVWPFVKSAGKPGWWIILLLIPIAGVFVAIYLWMCICENLGKNKWLGLLIVVPVASAILPIYLAFSKSVGGYSGGAVAGGGMSEMPDLSGEPQLPDLDFDLNEPGPPGGKDEFPG